MLIAKLSQNWLAHAVDDDGDGGNVSDGSGHVGVATALASFLMVMPLSLIS